MVRWLACLSLLATVSQGYSQLPKDYVKDLVAWRLTLENQLKEPEGWLSVAGLSWLQEGQNIFGNGEGATVILPNRAGKGVLGVLTREGNKVTIQSLRPIKVNGISKTDARLRSDIDPESDLVEVGRIKFRIIVRGKRVGVRVYDPQSDAMKSFQGRYWYQPDPTFRIRAKFTPSDGARTVPIVNVLGDTTVVPVVGEVSFTKDGKLCKLTAIKGARGLFLNFTDATTGKTTYDAGRFLDTDEPSNGYVILDFNRATCPPCAFTHYATCPLPPQGNNLPIEIRAGEKAPKR